jgi:hypothetical protein
MDILPFTDWFEAQGFRHFKAAEFTGYFAAQRKGTRNGLPPEKLWPNLLPTLRIVDDLREMLDRPCQILISYRSPEYNRAVDGSPPIPHIHRIPRTCVAG